MAYRPIERDVRARALAMLEEGSSLRAIGRELGVHPSTISWWRDGGGVTRDGRSGERRADAIILWRSGGSRHRDAWAYLLGVYLGDGYVDTEGRLRIFCDERYPGIISEIDVALRCIGIERPWHGTEGRCRTVSAGPARWATALPTGSGLKHTYRVELSGWQCSALATRPHLILRGLIHSDGCRFVNEVRVRGRAYRYPTYEFSNRSQDIHAIFSAACEALGLAPRPLGRGNAQRVARRHDVSVLDLVVGAKR